MMHTTVIALLTALSIVFVTPSLADDETSPVPLVSGLIPAETACFEGKNNAVIRNILKEGGDGDTIEIVERRVAFFRCVVGAYERYTESAPIHSIRCDSPLAIRALFYAIRGKMASTSLAILLIDTTSATEHVMRQFEGNSNFFARPINRYKEKCDQPSVSH